MGMAYWTMDGERRKQEMNAELRIKNILLFAAGVIAMGTTTSCRKDLCYNHDEHALTVKLTVKATWEKEWERDCGCHWENAWHTDWGCEYHELCPEAGEGIRTVVYTPDGKYAEGNIQSEGGRVPKVTEGANSILLYNNDTEYIVFDNISSSATASASTRIRSRSSFSGLHADERTVTPPDVLYGHYIDDYWGERTLEPVVLPVEMRPLTYTYLIRYEFKSGLQYVALARGALAGMAESVYLKDGHTGSEAATILYDCTVEDFGAEARVHSFGVPDYPGEDYVKRAEKVYTLNLEVRLKNGKILEYVFDVTDQMADQPRGGVILVKDIVVDDEDGTEGSPGFEPDIDGWGEYEDIELPVN